MLGLRRIWVIALAVPLLAILAGCTVDPLERLTEDIKSQDKDVRQRAVVQLANLDDERTLDSLIDVLSSDDELCDLAGVTLVKKGREVKEPDPKKPNPVVDEVGKILNNTHLTEPFRGRAAWVLGEIGDRRAIGALQGGQAALVGAKPALVVREMAKQGLEKIGYFSDGRSFDIPMGSLTETVEILPQAPPLATL
ncbi:MAG: HEAT repeat domain-containing protein [Armatimonadota bacterium]